ncbi:transporter, major facilitator family protein [Streptococcus sp. oral taxon 056 str. F0418]|nr:transporter, major facilitator family protein [Streptococcus sp. oral taxon 056 str. F0418]
MVIPFMSLFVEELGVKGHMVDLYAGIAVSSSAMTAAFLSPVWGSLADKYGRKPMMIRAALAMTFTMGGMAFVPNIFWLIALRLLNGVFSGYVPNSTALIASQAPKKYSGYALGTLSTGVVAGTLMGPLLGGVIAQTLGMRDVFLLVGFFLALVTLLTIFGVREDFQPMSKEKQLGTKELLAKIPQKSILFGLFLTSMVIQMVAQSIAPILTLYIRSMGQSENLMFISGLIVSAMGISSILASSHLGKLGDKMGNHRLLLMALLYSFVIYFLCAWARTPIELGILRFLFGLGTGALLPGVSSLLNKITPKEGISRIFSYNQTFFYIGGVVGPLMGSTIAVSLGYHWVFYTTAAMVLLDFFVMFICFRKYLGVKEISAR